MRIHQLGDGRPEVAIVGSIHGDEPCGARAIERLVAEEPPVERPVKLIVANEEALERGVRFIDEDLNRVFPGDADADTHERRLAHDLGRELRDCTTLSLHSTQSYEEAYVLVDTVDSTARTVCPQLPVEIVVETGEYTEGRLIAFPHTIEAECGYQRSVEAAENAYWLTRAFLTAVGVLPESEQYVAPEDREVTAFHLGEEIPKPPGEEYEVFCDNFERVEAGDVFAAVDGQELVAESAFYPILLSPYGYRDVLGYAGDRLGTFE